MRSPIPSELKPEQITAIVDTRSNAPWTWHRWQGQSAAQRRRRSPSPPEARSGPERPDVQSIDQGREHARAAPSCEPFHPSRRAEAGQQQRRHGE